MKKHPLFRQIAVLIFALTCLLGFTGNGYAQTPRDDTDSSTDQVSLETITVTAEKREKDIQTIPSSVTAVSDMQIDDFGLTNTIDLTLFTPNLYFTNMGNGISYYASMRGIFPASISTPTVGVYVDDVPYPGSDISFYDIERIEVLRGPQGTLYGRSSEAGIINIITQKPSDEWEGNVQLDTASFNTHSVKGTLSGPVLEDRLGFKAAFKYLESDGYFENQYDNNDEAGCQEDLDGRVTFTATPNDKLSLTFTADFQNSDSDQNANYAPLDASDMRKSINVDYPGEASKKASGVSLRGEYQFEGMKLVSITAAHTEDRFYSNDIDFTPSDLMDYDYDHDVTSYTQEIRLISNRPESSLQWLAGLFLLSSDEDSNNRYWMNFMNMGMGVPGENLYRYTNTDTQGGALFGEATYSFANGLDLTLGLRYDREQVDFKYSQQPSGTMLEMLGYSALSASSDEDFEAWLPKLALSYHLSDTVRPYFILSRGFRSGGFNSIDNIGTSFDPEFSWNYELGAKTSWWNDKLRLNAALFYIDRTDMMVDIMSSDGNSSYIDNAAKASSKGVELELMARPVRSLELVAGAAYTDAQYEEYKDETGVFDGNKVTNSPEYTFNLGATYRHISGFFLNLHYNHFGEIYFDRENTRSQGSYGLFGAKIGYEGERFDIYVYSENMFDQEYATRAFETNGIWYGRAGAPQTFGITLRARF